MALTDKRIALITGGSQGIGAATARALVAKDYFVVINYSSNTATATGLVEELGATNSVAMKADASIVSDTNTLVDTVVSKYGRIDALICSAGRLGLQDISETTEAGFDSLFAINVKGPYFLAQRAAPHMPPESHIVLLSTTQCHASTVTPEYILYNMTKGALEQMVRVLAKTLGPKGVFVKAVAPGPTATDMFLNSGRPQAVLDKIASFSPHNRIGDPKDVADAIVFLTQNRWVSGQIVKVNGGMA
ncbi:NAD(P)-binding protein [Aureobasidium subglaciale]|nr:NAD(P)-binding protein [Aureobasidium subglaciale]